MSGEHRKECFACHAAVTAAATYDWWAVEYECGSHFHDAETFHQSDECERRWTERTGETL